MRTAAPLNSCRPLTGAKERYVYMYTYIDFRTGKRVPPAIVDRHIPEPALLTADKIKTEIEAASLIDTVLLSRYAAMISFFVEQRRTAAERTILLDALVATGAFNSINNAFIKEYKGFEKEHQDLTTDDPMLLSLGIGIHRLCVIPVSSYISKNISIAKDCALILSENK